MTLSLSDISKKLKDIDFAMLSTFTAGGEIASRPMSNNGDVEYDGDNYFFAFEDSHTIKEIAANDHVGLTFVGSKGLLGKPPIFIAIEAKAHSSGTRPHSRPIGTQISRSGRKTVSIRRA